MDLKLFMAGVAAAAGVASAAQAAIVDLRFEDRAGSLPGFQTFGPNVYLADQIAFRGEADNRDYAFHFTYDTESAAPNRGLALVSGQLGAITDFSAFTPTLTFSPSNQLVISLSRLQTPLSRVAAAFGALFLLGGAIGVSAAAGFEPARDVLSALHIVDNDDDGDKNAEGPQDPPKSDDDEGVAPESTKDDDDDRPVATKTPTPKADDERPVATKTPTPKRDSDPVKPTATKKSRDVDPSDRRPTKTPTPRRIRPTNTPYHEPTKTPEEEKPTKTPEPPKPTKTATPTKKPDEPI